jgi:tetratricopeptide (TPR) repeat protein
MSKQLVFLILFLALNPWPMQARAQQPQPPMTQDEVTTLIKQNKKNPDLILKALDERKVDFDLNRDIEKKMRKAGATDDVLQGIWRAGPSGRNGKSASLVSATGGQLQATYQEAMGYQTLQAELDPDKKLRMVEEFEKQFPNSQLLSYVYTQAASACQQKNDMNGMLDYGEKSLKLDPDNTYSLILVAITLPQPHMQRVEPAIAAKRLAEADEDAKRALALMEKLAKRPNEADEEFQKRKAALQSEAHAALGMVHLQRDEPDKAIEEFKIAVSLEAEPDPQIYFRMGEVYDNEGKKAEAIEAFTKASESGRGTPIKDLADQEIEKLKKQ